MNGLFKYRESDAAANEEKLVSGNSGEQLHSSGNLLQNKFGGRDNFNNNLKTGEVRRFANAIDQIQDYPVLRKHQNNVCKYLDRYHGQLRGFMLTHEMGTGKTPTAVFALDVLKKHYPDRKLLVIAPKALHENFRATIERFQDSITHYGPEDVAFVSSNAPNFFDQLMLAHATPQQAKLFKNNKSTYIPEKHFDKFLVIIDEAHNLFSNIANAKHVIKREGAQLEEYTRAERVYNLIMAADDPKIVYMSGTPIANSPFEFAIAANMFKGWITSGGSSGSGSGKEGRVSRTTVFPEEHSKFNEYFINESGVGMKNMKEFQSRIYGCGSFYGKDYYDPETQALYPRFTRKVEYVPMGDLQFTRYVVKAIELENLKMERKGDFKLEVERWEKERDLKYADAQFRISLRQISNVFTPPGYDAKTYAKLPSAEKKKIADFFLDDIATYSPKIKAVVDKLEADMVPGKKEGAPGVLQAKTIVYSHFVTTIEFFKIFLQSKKIAFGTVTGDDSAEERNAAVERFNDPQSGYNLMIISSAGAEGLDLKGVRNVHILEPQYNLNRIEQVETRGVRFKSHFHLPEQERHVNIYLYICTFGGKKAEDFSGDPSVSQKQVEYILSKPSVDVDLYQKSVQKKKTYNDLIECIKRSAVDCYNYRPENECINAVPMNKPLYELNIPYDISSGGYKVDTSISGATGLRPMMRLFTKVADSGESYVFKKVTPVTSSTNSGKDKGPHTWEPVAEFNGVNLVSTAGSILNKARFHLDGYLKKPDAYTAVFYESDAPMVDSTVDLTPKNSWGGPLALEEKIAAEDF